MKKNVSVQKIVEQGMKPKCELKGKKGSKSPMISITAPIRKKITIEKRSYVEANYNMNGMSKFFSPVPA